MNEMHINRIAGELGLKEQQVRAAAQLLDEEATVPFIARYRKESTGGRYSRFASYFVLFCGLSGIYHKQ